MRGLVAGAVGTLAMDLVWFGRYKGGGGEGGFGDWEFSSTLARPTSSTKMATVTVLYVTAPEWPFRRAGR